MVSVAAHGAALLLLSASMAVAQLALPSLMPNMVNVTSGATNLPGAGPVYKREDTLAPVSPLLGPYVAHHGASTQSCVVGVCVVGLTFNVSIYHRRGTYQ